MANDFYNASGYPAQSSFGASASARAEFRLIAAGFDKLPPLTTKNNQLVHVNSSGSALTVTPGLTYDGSALGVPGALAVAGAGPHAIGTTPNTGIQLLLGGAFAGSGATRQVKLGVTGSLTGIAGQDVLGGYLAPALTEAGSGTHGRLAGLWVAPTFSGAAAATTDAASLLIAGMALDAGVTNGASLKIESAPSGATNNYALWVAAGATKLDGTLTVAGAATLSSTLNVTGAATLNSTLNVTGAATLNSTLNVTGAATLNSTLNVTGAATLSSTLNVTGNTIITGTLGIGTTSPTSLHQLTVAHASNARFDVRSDTAGHAAVRIISNHPDYGSIDAMDATYTIPKHLVLQPNGGNVGIGTAPSEKLHVVGGSSRFDGTVLLGATTGLIGNDGTEYYRLVSAGASYRHRAGSGGHHIWETFAGAELMRLTESGLLGIGTPSPAARLHVGGAGKVDGTLTVNGAAALNNTLDVTGAATLNSTLNVTGAATLNSTLNVTGNTIIAGTLGIGTLAPVAGSLLHVKGPNGAANDARPFLVLVEAVGDESGNELAGIGFRAGNSGGAAGIKTAIAQYRDARGYGQGALVFLQNSAADSSSVTLANEVMRIDPAGNVGIGTPSPAARLHVANGAVALDEIGDPAAPAANRALLYARDDGAGKTQLVARFNSGAVLVLSGWS